MAKSKQGIDLYKAASALEKQSQQGSSSEFTGGRPTNSLESSASAPAKKGSRSGKPGLFEKKKKTRDEAIDKGKTDPMRPSGGFLKTTGPQKPQDEMSAAEKAARMLLLLGKDEAADVMARLDPREAEEIAKHIASTKKVDAVEAKALLNEFGDRYENLEPRRVTGGLEAAKSILTEAFGEEKALEIVEKAVPEAKDKPFSFLADLDFSQLAGLLRKEQPTSLALILTYLEPLQASKLLESMPDEERGAVILRMARTEKVSTAVLETVEDALREKVRLIGRDDSEELDGRSALADILRYMDMGDERRLLDELGDADPELAEQVKEKLYTMDSVIHLQARDLQGLLFDMDDRDIAMILKGQSPEVKDKIIGSLSSRRRLQVADEGDLMGPRPRSEVDAAVKDFLETIRKGEEAGTYLIIREEDDLIE